MDFAKRKVSDATMAGKQLVETAKRVGELGGKAARTVADAAQRGAMAVGGRVAAKDTEVTPEVVVSELPEGVKRCYLETLVWLTYQNDRVVDECEVCELQVLMTQLECHPETRQALRGAITDPTSLDPENLIPRMREGARTSEETQDDLGFSLLKDAIRLGLATSRGGSPVLAGGIRRLADLLGINEKQLDFIEEACVQDRKMLGGRISDRRLEEIAKDLAAKSAAVGVPITAVYLSGSVTGLSAAGITSGLAALGLGGVLGLSAMISGLGIAVVGGAVIYRGARWFMGSSKRARSARRELMLQEVLHIHQKAIANLTEDIAYFADWLVGLTRDVERNRLLIERLSNELALLGRALAQLRQREHAFEDDLREEINQRQPADNEETDETGS